MFAFWGMIFGGWERSRRAYDDGEILICFVDDDDDR